MKSLTKGTIEKLKILEAIDEETQASRNQLPPEPWIPEVRAKKKAVAKWINSLLMAGLPTVANSTVNVRKLNMGTRPVPIMGIAERMIYRAVSKRVLGKEFPFDRSQEAYNEFIFGPLEFVAPDGDLQSLMEPRIKYVVEADIAAFYQYIDHSVLQRELELQTGEIEYIDILISLLGEVEQNTFGLPQLVDASDWLSEAYIRIIERNLIRRGIPVWRYNDDFKIGCRDYTAALDAIETLEELARDIGLIVSDYKTHTPTLETYLSNHTNIDLDSVEQLADYWDPNIVLTEYETLDDDDEELELALETIDNIRIGEHGEAYIDLKSAVKDEVGKLRRAISSFTRHGVESGLDSVIDLLTYVPSLTPRLCEYIVAVNSKETRQRITQIVDQAIDEVFLSEWQALWIVYSCRELQILSNNPSSIEWVKSQRERGRGKLLGAEAVLTLATAGAADFEDLDESLRLEPDALAPWFLLAIKSMTAGDPKRYGDRTRAIGNTDPLYRILLGT